MREKIISLQQENKLSQECTFQPKILKRNHSERNFKDNNLNQTCFEERLKM